MVIQLKEQYVAHWRPPVVEKKQAFFNKLKYNVLKCIYSPFLFQIENVNIILLFEIALFSALLA